MSSTSQNIIDIKKIAKSFLVGNQQIPVLKDINFQVNSGDFLIIFGPSGCGKSTLLHTILGLETPTSGSIDFFGKSLYSQSTEDDRSEFRKKNIGMVYQQPNWIKALNVVENVEFPLILTGIDQSSRRQKAIKFLTELEMQSWAEYHPSELSSGQQQKVALVRALITDPKIIIADEPTGNLDYDSGRELMLLLSRLNQQGKTIIMVTHDLEYIRYSKTAIRMLDGQVLKHYPNSLDLLKELDYKRISADVKKQ